MSCYEESYSRPNKRGGTEPAPESRHRKSWLEGRAGAIAAAMLIAAWVGSAPAANGGPRATGVLWGSVPRAAVGGLTDVLSGKKAAQDIAAEAKPATVKIETSYLEEDFLGTTEGGLTGTGVIVHKDEDGDYWIATNSHVWGLNDLREEDLDGEPEIKAYSLEVKFHDGKKTPAIMLLDHLSEDCAIIIVSGRVGTYPIAPLAEGLPQSGDTVYALGHALGDLDYSFTKGMVSAVRNNSDDSARPFRHIQTDTAISPGNSGGPLLNEKGEVLGLNTYARVGGENLNFALSIDDVIRDIIEDRFYHVPLSASGLTEFFKN